MRIVGTTLDLITQTNAELVIGDKFKSGVDYAVDTVDKNLNNTRLYGLIQKTVLGTSARIELVNKYALDALKAETEAQTTVEQIQTEFSDADINGIQNSLTDISDKRLSITENIGDIGKDVDQLKKATTTSTGDTLDTIEERVQKLEDAAQPAEGRQ